VALSLPATRVLTFSLADDEAVEGPFYTQIGTAATVEGVRRIMEERYVPLCLMTIAAGCHPQPIK